MPSISGGIFFGVKQKLISTAIQKNNLDLHSKINS